MIWLIVAGAMFLICLAGMWVVVPHLLRKCEEQKLRELCREKRFIALSYDDGPGESLTGKLLDLLKDNKVKATFFVLGNRAEQRGDMVKRLVDEGHAVGSHSQNHLHAWKSLPWNSICDIDAGLESLAQKGVRSRLFRPPFGKLVLPSWLYVKRRRIDLVWWTVDSADSLENRKEIDKVVEEVRNADGGVVLMHDYDGYKLPGHGDYVLTLTGRLIEMAREEKLTLVTAHELFAR